MNSPTAQILVIEAGVNNTLQDAGRHGYRALGIPQSGALDRDSLAAVNALVGNPAHACALECSLLGPRLRCTQGPLTLALLGWPQALRWRDGQTQAVADASTIELMTGDELQLGPSQGTAYLGAAGGWQSPPVLGSTSTYTRAHLGGVHGRALQTGDTLQALNPNTPALCAPTLPAWRHDTTPLRIMAAPQTAAFPDDNLARLCEHDWIVSAQADRMGLRLNPPDAQAPPLTAQNGAANQMVSDGVLPGAIQVTPHGQAVILLADGQTVGGYPKIAAVIQADLPRLAHWRPGQRLRLTWVEREQAKAALRAQAKILADWCASLHPPVRQPDTTVLLGANLISGIINGHDD